MPGLAYYGGGMLFIGVILEGFFFGFYSGIFAMYLWYQTSRKDTNKKQSIIFYAICGLYGLSVGLFVLDVVRTIYQLFGEQMVLRFRLYVTQAMLFGCCDFIAQSILIYRCWIVWGCNIRVVIIPSMLAVAFLVIWVASNSSVCIFRSDNISVAHVFSDDFSIPHWAISMALLAIVLSLAINALVMGLIVFRIFKVFREVRATNDEILGTTGGSKLRRIIFVLIESGMALFSVQFFRFVVYVAKGNDPGPSTSCALAIITHIHNMLNGITPTIILVRTSMGLSFHDEKSMEEAAIGSLCFAFNDPNSVPETRSICQDGKEDDSDFSPSNDIDMVHR